MAAARVSGPLQKLTPGAAVVWTLKAIQAADRLRLRRLSHRHPGLRIDPAGVLPALAPALALAVVAPSVSALAAMIQALKEKLEHPATIFIQD